VGPVEGAIEGGAVVGTCDGLVGGKVVVGRLVEGKGEGAPVGSNEGVWVGVPVVG